MNFDTLIHSWPFIFALALGGLFLAGDRGFRRKIESLRARGYYPAEGAGTDTDVRNLVSMGEKAAAVRLYRDIHGVGLKAAKEAVEAVAAATISS